MDYKSIIYKISIGIIFIILLLASYKLVFFYIPFLIAYIISILVEPIIKFISKRTNFTRKTSSIITLVIIFSILIAIVVWLIITIINEATNLLNGINTYINQIIHFLNSINLSRFNLSPNILSVLENSISDFLNLITTKAKDILTFILNYITSIPNIFINLIITILATYFITSDKFYILDRMEHHLSKKLVGKIIIHSSEILSALGKYLKAEIILSFITFIIVLTGLNIFYLIGFPIEYPLLMGFLIGFIDALPILGAGSVMIPWSIILFFNGNSSFSLSMIGLYLFTLIAKQLLEPKIVSNNIGIHPIFTLFSMYTGFKLIGILGLIVGPIMLIIVKNIFSDAIDRGLFNSIIDS